jgi:hypothetical protein
MGLMRRVWDGPFKTPPQETITVGWALLKLFETAWRMLLIVLALIAALLLYLWQTEGSPLSSQVRVELSDAAAASCQKGYPIFASITNKSRKNLGEVDLKFHVYSQGKSDDVSVGSPSELKDILRPRQSINYCYRMPELQEGATGPYTVVAEVTYASELSKDVPLPPEPPPLVRVSSNPFHPDAPPQTIWTKVIGWFVVMICLALGASGGFGLIALCHRVFGVAVLEKFKSKKGDNTGWLIFLFAILNLAIVSAGSFALTSWGIDGWVTALDNWSWGHGLQDGGSILLAAVCAQWPWAVWLAIDGPKHLAAAGD